MSDMTGKWGQEVADRGFAQIPNYLLLLNQFLADDKKLSPVELLVLFQLVGNWWRKDEQPFPSMLTLAIRCGVSERQIQRAVATLEKVNLIKRVSRRRSGIIASNAYDMEPLVALLQQVAKAFPNEFPRGAAAKAAQDRKEAASASMPDRIGIPTVTVAPTSKQARKVAVRLA